MAGSRSEPPATKTAANSVQHSHSGSGLASGIAAYTHCGASSRSISTRWPM